MYEHVYTWYEHVCTQYVHGTYQASPFTYLLSQQVFMANTEMEYRVISLFPLLQGRMRMRVVLAQKMEIFLSHAAPLATKCHMLKLCCGETRITPRVKHQRYVQTCMYTFKLCMYMV